jgi:hypothetical protein
VTRRATTRTGEGGGSTVGAHDQWNTGSPRRSLLAPVGGSDWGGRASGHGQGEVAVPPLRDEKREALIGGRFPAPPPPRLRRRVPAGIVSVLDWQPTKGSTQSR